MKSEDKIKILSRCSKSQIIYSLSQKAPGGCFLKAERTNREKIKYWDPGNKILKNRTEMKAFLEGQQCGTPGPQCTRTGRSRRVRVSMRGIFRGKIFFFQKNLTGMWKCFWKMVCKAAGEWELAKVIKKKTYANENNQLILIKTKGVLEYTVLYNKKKPHTSWLNIKYIFTLVNIKDLTKNCGISSWEGGGGGCIVIHLQSQSINR